MAARPAVRAIGAILSAEPAALVGSVAVVAEAVAHIVGEVRAGVQADTDRLAERAARKRRECRRQQWRKHSVGDFATAASTFALKFFSAGRRCKMVLLAGSTLVLNSLRSLHRKLKEANAMPMWCSCTVSAAGHFVPGALHAAISHVPLYGASPLWFRALVFSANVGAWATGHLMFMGADDAAMAAFCGALGSGAAPALENLILMSNKIGDEGMRHLREALARGAAPVLKDLDVSSNPASDAAQQAVKDAIKVK